MIDTITATRDDARKARLFAIQIDAVPQIRQSAFLHFTKHADGIFSLHTR